MRISFGVLMSVSMAVCLGARAEIVAEIGENVKDNWRKISERCQKVAALTDEMPSLPDSSWCFWVTDKDDQREKIRSVQLRIRELMRELRSAGKSIFFSSHELGETALAEKRGDQKTVQTCLLEAERMNASPVVVEAIRGRVRPDGAAPCRASGCHGN